MAEPQKSVVIAEIGAAHGVRGEVRVKAHTADPLAVADYGPLHDSRGAIFRIKSLRHLKDDMLVVSFEGLTDRTAAEKLNRTKLHVDRSALPPPDEDEFYHADLIGLAVETTAGEAIGTVVAVVNFGADDLLDVKRPGRASVYVPFTRAVVPTLDFASGKAIIAPPDGLLDEPGEPDGEEAP
ncbi:Ribosome maturation factor RimM [Pleomorphomonas sp. T1.2MG-36]|uniref:ribosome maturation factor RimM n=1 Tax=Pleomorphomonas sp. T1.2MG-36 TaxID=3041167 RepID=UPI00247791E3|nr:ribosome maturation factor RimM [Pleomorphomonas sp. T1.2MG-36]CAI9414677.1 Ribosome maturation factor RimM [Pleomorphomonas sp. T1.2MG-36]